MKKIWPNTENNPRFRLLLQKPTKPSNHQSQDASEISELDAHQASLSPQRSTSLRARKERDFVCTCVYKLKTNLIGTNHVSRASRVTLGDVWSWHSMTDQSESPTEARFFFMYHDFAPAAGGTL
ncbi:uncharacterized protein H6S33_008530 [Morchella sextelata]|uniref:uncharacterized protein n=1 Tax=Morchella sextelata TaxID=1174677 RepID=UPI001D058B0C|nr:uncharacterized protein H6S33_008530 [Morchella sextelata]KAH0602880.1 hypothetical protein H6S33_008530 [Morchella sextelata]